MLVLYEKIRENCEINSILGKIKQFAACVKNTVNILVAKIYNKF
jgi:hypothetical protein